MNHVSALTESPLISYLTYPPGCFNLCNILISSAKTVVSKETSSRQRFLYTRKKVGVSTEPFGTPIVVSRQSDRSEPSRTAIEIS